MQVTGRHYGLLNSPDGNHPFSDQAGSPGIEEKTLPPSNRAPSQGLGNSLLNALKNLQIPISICESKQYDIVNTTQFVLASVIDSSLTLWMMLRAQLNLGGYIESFKPRAWPIENPAMRGMTGFSIFE
jgi:hypothetical protein